MAASPLNPWGDLGRGEHTAADAQPVTPSDTVDVPASPAGNKCCVALWVGTTGDVALITMSGTTTTLKNVSGLLPVACTRVMSTNTTASNIVALYAPGQ